MNVSDFAFAASEQLSLPSLLSFTCGLALVIVAVIQSGKSSDDDGPGDGGLMQPVGAGA